MRTGQSKVMYKYTVLLICQIIAKASHLFQTEGWGLLCKDVGVRTKTKFAATE